MCSYKVLIHNESGYIIKYNNCLAYQVAFGTTIASFTASKFKQFYNQVNELKIITVPNGFPQQKRIHVEIGRCKTYMILNLTELNGLHELLEQSIVSEEIDQLLNFNNLTSSN